MIKMREYGHVWRGKLNTYGPLYISWRDASEIRLASRTILEGVIICVTHEISERSDGKWEVMDKSLKPKVYPDKDTMLTALALQGVNIDD